MTGDKALLSYKTGIEINEFIDHGIALKLDSNKKYCLATFAVLKARVKKFSLSLEPLSK